MSYHYEEPSFSEITRAARHNSAVGAAPRDAVVKAQIDQANLARISLIVSVIALGMSGTLLVMQMLH